MADLLSLLGGGSSSSTESTKTQSELLVDSYKRTQQPRVNTLNTKKRALESKQVYFNGLKSRIDSFVSRIDNFLASTASDEFDSKKVSVSNSDYFTVSATGEALEGSNSVLVKQVATADTLVSNQMSLSDNDFDKSKYSGIQELTFTINGSSTTVSVDFDSVTNNEEAMTAIVDAINDNEDVDIRASLVKDTTSTGRLAFTSENTGSENIINFEDSEVLKEFGIKNSWLNSEDPTNKVQLSASSAGYRNSSVSNLDAIIEIDGITVVRSTNDISDALNGINISVLKENEDTDQSVTITTDIDSESVKEFIEPLLQSFNEMTQFLNSNKTMLRGDSSISGLRYQMRTLATQEIDVEDGKPSRITDLGISIASDGTLSITDLDELEEYLEKDASAVANLFTLESSDSSITSSDGFASRMYKTISSMIGSDGLITSRKLSLGEQIDTITDRTEQLEQRIDYQAQIMRKEYESMLKLMFDAQGQYSLVQTF